LIHPTRALEDTLEKLRFAIVGCGVIASRHVVAFQELRQRGRDDFEIRAICDLDEAVRGQRQRPEVDGWEGLRSLAVCHAIYESASSGQAVPVEDVAAGTIDAYQRPIDEHWQLAPVLAGVGAAR
jgi:predicted dehydrogenase